MGKDQRHFILRSLCLWILAFLTACGTNTPQAVLQLVKVYATSAASPWLKNVYDCAPTSVAVSLSDTASADVTIRFGQPADLNTPAFQIGSDEILVVVNPQAGVSSLSANQVRDLFAGQIISWKDAGGNDIPVQVWVFDPGEDIQQVFDQVDMAGQAVTSQARLAVSAQNMSDSVAGNPGSIGILTRRLKTANVQDVFGGVSVPVLAITKSEPQGAVKPLIACLQK
ncbi:MAG: substrate-binding domain-containing protein [Chloroflexi bacterium]|nr:substrate-binding domain-containing protein [Chloroflexota bacterium]